MLYVTLNAKPFGCQFSSFISWKKEEQYNWNHFQNCVIGIRMIIKTSQL